MTRRKHKRRCQCRDAPRCGHTTVAEQRLAEAIWPRRDQPVDQADEPTEAIWCRADLSPFGGTYMLTIEYDADNVLALNRDSLLSYVATMTDALMRARYSEGVRRQLLDVLAKSAGLPITAASDQYAVVTVNELRQEWPELATFPPYEIRPCVSAEGRISVQVWRGDDVIAQLAPHNVHEHVVHALSVYAAADLDASYRRMLVGSIGLDPARASQVVDDLANYHREE